MRAWRSLSRRPGRYPSPARSSAKADSACSQDFEALHRLLEKECVDERASASLPRLPGKKLFSANSHGSKHLLAFLVDERFRDIDTTVKESQKLQKLLQDTILQKKSQQRDQMFEHEPDLEDTATVKAVQAKFLQSSTVSSTALRKSPTVSGVTDLARKGAEDAKDEEIRTLKSKIAALEKNQAAWIHCLQQFLFATIFDSSRQEDQRQRFSHLFAGLRVSHMVPSGWRKSCVKPSKRTRTERYVYYSYQCVLMCALMEVSGFEGKDSSFEVPYRLETCTRANADRSQRRKQYLVPEMGTPAGMSPACRFIFTSDLSLAKVTCDVELTGRRLGMTFQCNVSISVGVHGELQASFLNETHSCLVVRFLRDPKIDVYTSGTQVSWANVPMPIRDAVDAEIRRHVENILRKALNPPATLTFQLSPSDDAAAARDHVPDSDERKGAQTAARAGSSLRSNKPVDGTSFSITLIRL
eukprot:763395-Hanusia_phi.AAC.3